MSEFDILNIDEVEFENIIIPETIKNNNLNEINYAYKSNNSDKLRIATPWLDLLDINDKFCLLSLKVMSNEPKMHNVYEFIKNYDKLIIESCKKYKWFTENNISKIRFKKTFLKSSSIEMASDDTNNGWIYPVFRCSTFNSEVFDKKGKPISFTEISKNNRVKVALECSGVWFKDNKFGINWKVLQFLVGNQLSNDIEYSFRDSDDEDQPNDIIYDSEFTDVDY